MFRIQQTEDGWVVIEHDADEAIVASFAVSAEPHSLHASYAKALIYIGDRLSTMRAAQVASPEDGLLPERWTSREGIVFAEATGDGRDFTDCTFSWRDPKVSLVPLMLQTETDFGHFGAELVGFHEKFSREGDAVTSSGRFYDFANAVQARDLLLGDRYFGVSVDGGSVDYEWECVTEEDGWCIEDKITFTAYEIIGSTMTPFPAFARAAIMLEAETAKAATRLTVVTAAATDAPTVPPRAWFEMAEPDDDDERYVDQDDGRIAIPLTITDDGQIYGHAAADGVPHTGYPGRNIMAPKSESSYAHFHLGVTVCDDGSRVPTGVLTVGCDHAPLTYTCQEARDFYAHSGLGWGDVRASDGEHGIWIAGACRPGLDERQVRMIHGSSLSGHWVPIGGRLEMMGVLAVNQPGYPVLREAALAAAGCVGDDCEWFAPVNAPKPAALVTAGEVVALVAAGIVRECPECLKRKLHDSALSALDPVLRDTLTTVCAGIATMTDALERIERRTRHLIPVEREAAVARLRHPSAS